MELYIIRHGETDWNKEKRLQGRSDIELNSYGIELARITSDALKDIKYDVIYSSPLKRAYTTAEIIRRDRPVEIITDERLVEMSFGDLEGVDRTKLPENFHLFFDEPENFETIPNGESYEQLVARASDFIDNVVIPASTKYDNMLVVAHGALNRALMITLNHESIKDMWSGIFQHNCCVNIYEIKGQDSYTMHQNGKVYYDLNAQRKRQ